MYGIANFHLLKVAIRCSFLEEEVKELHGIHVKPTMTLHQHFKCSLATTSESVESLLNHWIAV